MKVNHKLGFGPMSHEIVDSLIEYSTIYNYPLMIIASRNQADYSSGYVCDTETLSNKLKNSESNILLCRDHCGPGFKDSDKNLTFAQQLDECFKTIESDIEHGFDLIHVDVSKCEKQQFNMAENLINRILVTAKNTFLEFGSEENLGQNIEESHDRIDEQLNFLQQYKDNVIFYTSQTGSLTKHTQVGHFDVEINILLAEKIHNAGFSFKEHNADYLNIHEIKKRKLAGVDALNIAPQLGQIQTNILKQMIMEDLDSTHYWNKFANMVYEKSIWRRWLPDNLSDKNLAVLASGHYFFNSDEYKKILDNISYELYVKKIRKTVFELINLYRNLEK